MSLTINAQIDSQKKSIAIPAIESKKDSAVTSIPFPSKTNQNNSFSGLSVPKTDSNFNVPKKEFSMFGETFGNPGELYNKRLSKVEDELQPEGYGEYSGIKEDTYWGDYRTKSEYIDIAVRDYGLVDGDLLSILFDDDVIKPNIYLTENFKGFRLKLNNGLNKIDFLALNEGTSLPNTAQYKVLDQWNNLITGKIWALGTKVKVTLIIVKE